MQHLSAVASDSVSSVKRSSDFETQYKSISFRDFKNSSFSHHQLKLWLISAQIEMSLGFLINTNRQVSQ